MKATKTRSATKIPINKATVSVLQGISTSDSSALLAYINKTGHASGSWQDNIKGNKESIAFVERIKLGE